MGLGDLPFKIPPVVLSASVFVLRARSEGDGEAGAFLRIFEVTKLQTGRDVGVLVVLCLGVVWEREIQFKWFIKSLIFGGNFFWREGRGWLKAT